MGRSTLGAEGVSPHTFDVFDPTRLQGVLDAARRGENQAFEVIYRELNRPVAAFAMARRAPDPDVIVNEVFLRVFTNLGTFAGNESQFVGWVFRITRNLIVDDARQRSKHHTEPWINATCERACNGTAADEAIAHLESERLLRHIDQLSPAQRDVVLLRVIADQSIEVTAEILGKSVSAVKSLHMRAVRALADSLATPEIDLRHEFLGERA